MKIGYKVRESPVRGRRPAAFLAYAVLAAAPVFMPGGTAFADKPAVKVDPKAEAEDNIRKTIEKYPELRSMAQSPRSITDSMIYHRAFTKIKPDPTNINPYSPVKSFNFKPPFQKPVIMNLWAEWCEPCKAEMPDFERIHQSGDAIVIGFTSSAYIDGQVADNNAKKRKGLARGMDNGDIPKVTYPILNAAGSYIHGQPLPTTIILDKNGMIVGAKIGKTDEATLRAFIEAFQ